MSDFIGLAFVLIFSMVGVCVLFLRYSRQKKRNKKLKGILVPISKAYFENLKGNICYYSNSQLRQRQHSNSFDLFFGDYGLIIIQNWWLPIYIPSGKQTSDLEHMDLLAVKYKGHKKNILYKNIDIEMEGRFPYKQMRLIAKSVHSDEIEKINELLSELRKTAV